MKSSSVLAAACAALLGAAAVAQTPPDTNRPSVPPNSQATPPSATPPAARYGSPTNEADFFKTMAQGGMTEVEAGKLATQHASNSEVKKFAQTMVTDHTKSNEKLKALAKERQVTLPTKLDEKHASDKAMLEKHRGAAFDSAYMDAQVKAHEKTVQLLQQQANSTDAKIRAFAQETLPTVQHHLQMAKDIQGKVGGATSRTDDHRTHEPSARAEPSRSPMPPRDDNPNPPRGPEQSREPL